MTTQTQNLGKALITGASTGIGAVYADRLAKRGYDLILVARDENRLQALAQRLRAETGVQIEVIKADLTKRADLAKVESRLREDAGISLLLNNAGMSVGGSFVGGDVEQYDTMLQLNIVAVMRLASAAAATFAAKKQGTLINVASVLALAPELFDGVYSGTKAFVLNMTHALQRDLSPLGVRVQAVLPGATRTEIWERSGTDVDTLPAGMVMGVDDMVNAALVGLDQGEVITIPPLQEIADWDNYLQARLALAPKLSVSKPAARYTKA
ncbi:SDR family oxidoreductase [Chitinimonas sp.]|uniref:SDR family NAD(P)-dependent oxidoreductase n=1 Tax=Chitinimonas sp. TaxID=1934313 RepID=UPI002F926C34